MIKYLMTFLVLFSFQSQACLVHVKFVKNQTPYKLSDFKKLTDEMEKLNYIISEKDASFIFEFRLLERHLYSGPHLLIAKANFDAYSTKNNEHVTHSHRTGKPNSRASVAYSKKNFERILVQLVDELPYCDSL
jgi:hypothetical protein